MVNDNEVLFTEDYFVAILPEYWYQVTQSPGYYQYRSTKGDENLSVSVFPSEIKDYLIELMLALTRLQLF